MLHAQTRTGTAACAASGSACPTAAFAASGLTRTCSKADFAACLCLYSRLRPLDSSVLQQHVLPLDVCLFFDRLCCLWLSVPQQPWSLFGLFRFVSKQFCLFRLFRYGFETPKQTEILCFWFHETNRNKRETDLVSVCFGSNRNLFLFVSRTPYPEGRTSTLIIHLSGAALPAGDINPSVYFWW